MNLYQLIQDLTDSELGQLIKRLSADNSNNNIAVIKTLRAQKVYNSKEIQEKFGWDKNTLTTRLNTAQEATLKFLRERTRSEKVTNTIESKLQDVRILFNRSLYNAATIAAKKADRAAQKVQAKPLTEAQIWRLKIAFVQSKLGLITKNIKEVETLYQSLNQPIPYNLAYWILFLKIVAIMRQSNKERNNEQSQNELKQILEHPLLSNAFIPNAPEQKALYHYIKSLAYQINSKPIRAIEQATKMIYTFEANRILIETDSSVYVSGLNNICMMLLKSGLDAKNKIKVYLQKIRIAPRTRKDSEQDIITRYYQNLLFLLNQQKDYQEAIKVINEFEQIQKQFEKPILLELFALITARILMYSGEYNQALNYLTELINKPTKNIKNPTTIMNAKILYLACLYSVGQDEFLSSMYSPIRQYLKKKGYWDMSIDLLFSFFKNTAKFKNMNDNQQAEIKLKRTIEAYQKENGIIGFLCYFDIVLWLNQLSTTRANNQSLPLTCPSTITSHH